MIPSRQALLLGFAALGAPAAVVALAPGCGASVQSIHEGNVRFEHCYRLDLDPKIAASHRQACWQDWEQRYTYGQTRDRLEYARRRARQIAAGEVGMTLALEAGVDGAEVVAPADDPAPAPTSLHAPPPALARTQPVIDAGPAPEPAPKAPLPKPPGWECAEKCRTAWADCSGPCGPDAGLAGTRRCKACEPDYKACLRRCIR